MITSHSTYGIPSEFFIDRPNLKIKLYFDPSPSLFFTNQLLKDREFYTHLILFDGCEPQILNNIEAQLIDNHYFFDKIYTSNPILYNNLSNAEKFIYGTSWVLTDKNFNTIRLKKDYYNCFNMNKKFKLSFIRSEKKFLPGHKLRHEITEIVTKQRNFELLFPRKWIDEKKVFV